MLRIGVFCLLLAGCAASKQARELRQQQAQHQRDRQEAEDFARRVQIVIPPIVHVGKSLKPTITGPDALTLTVPEFSTALPGEVTQYVTGSYRTAEVRIPVTFRVSEPTSSPWFPLEAGNQWVFNQQEVKSKRTGTVVLIFPKYSRTRSTIERFLVIDVLEPVEHPTHVEYTGRISHQDTSIDLRLAAADGDTLVMNNDQWQPMVLVDEPPSPQAFAFEKVACQVPSLSLVGCECNAYPQGEVFAPSGPQQCTLRRVSGGASANDVVESVLVGIATLGTYIPTNGKTTTTTKVNLVEHRRPSAQISLDTDPYFTTLGTRVLIWPKWKKHWATLRKNHPLHLEVAAALWLMYQKEERIADTLLYAVKEHANRGRMVHLGKTDTDKFLLQSKLDAPDQRRFGPYVLRHRERLTTPSSSLGLVQEAHKTAPLVPAKADALVCKWLDTKERIHLHRAMAKTVSVEALEPWIERCAKAIRSNPPPIQTARVRWELQQPFSHPIVQSLFDLNPKASDEDDIVALIPVLAGMHAIGADAAMALVDLADPFWNKKTVLRGLAPHLSPTEKNVILARASFTQKSWTAEALGLPKP